MVRDGSFYFDRGIDRPAVKNSTKTQILNKFRSSAFCKYSDFFPEPHLVLACRLGKERKMKGGKV